MKYHWLAAAALITATSLAQGEPSAAKKDLIDKIIAAQQATYDNAARGLVQAPAAQMMQAANQVVQTQVPPEKRAAVSKSIDADAKKYVDEASPIAIATMKKLVPVKVPPLLDAKFSEAELKTLLAWLTSPVNKKFQDVAPELQKALIDPMVAEAGPQITPKLQALEQHTRATLQAAVAANPASAPATGSKPAGK